MLRVSSVLFSNNQPLKAVFYIPRKNKKPYESMFIEFVRYYDLIDNKWIANNEEINAINTFIKS